MAPSGVKKSATHVGGALPVWGETEEGCINALFYIREWAGVTLGALTSDMGGECLPSVVGVVGGILTSLSWGILLCPHLDVLRFLLFWGSFESSSCGTDYRGPESSYGSHRVPPPPSPPCPL